MIALKHRAAGQDEVKNLQRPPTVDGQNPDGGWTISVLILNVDWGWQATTTKMVISLTKLFLRLLKY